MADKLKISDISKLFDIPISALRYYEKEGLCSFKRSDNNYRWADLRTIRNLCDISFYRKLSCSIGQIQRLSSMEHQEISALLLESREKIEQQIQELYGMLENIDEKVGRIQKIDALTAQPAGIVMARLPAIREFNLFRNSDISNLISYERDLFLIIDPSDAEDYRYGLLTDTPWEYRDLVYPGDKAERPYYKVLLKTDYELIEKNNLQEYYEQIAALGYTPGRIFGKVLVSAKEDKLYNFYEAWIELLE